VNYLPAVLSLGPDGLQLHLGERESFDASTPGLSFPQVHAWRRAAGVWRCGFCGRPNGATVPPFAGCPGPTKGGK